MIADSAAGIRAERRAARTESLCTRGARYVTGSDIARISRALVNRTSGALGHRGLEELAPVSCRVFPEHLGDGAAPAGEKPGKERQLTEADLDQELPAEAERGWTADRDRRFVRSRNAAVDADKQERKPSELHDFLLDPTGTS